MPSRSIPPVISLVIAGALVIFVGIYFGLKFSPAPDQIQRPTGSQPKDTAKRRDAEEGDFASATQAATPAANPPESTVGIERVSDMRFDPIAELRRFGIAPTVENLMSVTTDEGASPDARYWSAMALGKIDAPGAGPLLAGLLRSSSNITVRLGAIGGLAYLSDSVSIETLGSHVRHDPSEQIRLAVINAIYRSGSASAHEIIIEAAVDHLQSLSVRVHSAQALAQDLSESEANTLRVLLVDEHVELRAVAAIAMSRDYSDEVLPTLVDSVLDDELPFEMWDQLRLRLQEISGVKFAEYKSSEYDSSPTVRMATNRDIEDWWKKSTGTN